MLESFILQIFNSESYCGENLFIVFKYAYTEKELELEKYSIEVCTMPFNSNPDYRICWFNDWYEGQNFIDLLGIFGENHLIEILLDKLQG